MSWATEHWTRPPVTWLRCARVADGLGAGALGFSSVAPPDIAPRGATRARDFPDEDELVALMTAWTRWEAVCCRWSRPVWAVK